MQDDETQKPGRPFRRMSDFIMAAFHRACDLADYEIAEKLLRVAETAVQRGRGFNDVRYEREMAALVAAHERLWSLRHPDDPR